MTATGPSDLVGSEWGPEQRPAATSARVGAVLAGVGGLLVLAGAILPWSSPSHLFVADEPAMVEDQLGPGGSLLPLVAAGIGLLALAGVCTARLRRGLSRRSRERLGVATMGLAVLVGVAWGLRLVPAAEWWTRRPSGGDGPKPGDLALAFVLPPLGAVLAAVGGVLLVPGREQTTPDG